MAQEDNISVEVYVMDKQVFSSNDFRGKAIGDIYAEMRVRFGTIAKIVLTVFPEPAEAGK